MNKCRICHVNPAMKSSYHCMDCKQERELIILDYLLRDDFHRKEILRLVHCSWSDLKFVIKKYNLQKVEPIKRIQCPSCNRSFWPCHKRVICCSVICKNLHRGESEISKKAKALLHKIIEPTRTDHIYMMGKAVGLSATILQKYKRRLGMESKKIGKYWRWLPLIQPR